jgi:hypothetical protein
MTDEDFKPPGIRFGGLDQRDPKRSLQAFFVHD